MQFSTAQSASSMRITADEVQGFERELKAKVSHKSSSHQSEEGFLVKQFKFFDIYNTGVLSFDNFYRTVEKIGMVIDKEDSRQIYPHLSCVDANEELDYKSYAKYLYSKSFVEAYKPMPKGQTYSPSKAAVYDDSEGGTPACNVLRSGMNSQDYPLATTAHFYRPTSSAGRKSLMNPYYVNEQMIESLAQNLKDPDCAAPQESETESAVDDEQRSVFDYGHEPEYYMKNQYSKSSVPKSQVLYIERFNDELQKRGGRSIVGLLRQFKIFDTDSSGCLDKYEFKKAFDDYEIDVHPKDLDNLFNCFDKDKNGTIDYNEFFEAISGPLSKYRLQLVERVFDKLDRSGEGFVDMDYMLSCFDASRHPDVASGKNDEEGVYCEFKDHFEVYLNLCINYDSSVQMLSHSLLFFNIIIIIFNFIGMHISNEFIIEFIFKLYIYIFK